MFACMECGRKFKTVKAAERAAFGDKGCPKCGSSDIDLDGLGWSSPPVNLQFASIAQKQAAQRRGKTAQEAADDLVQKVKSADARKHRTDRKKRERKEQAQDVSTISMMLVDTIIENGIHGLDCPYGVKVLSSTDTGFEFEFENSAGRVRGFKVSVKSLGV